MIPDSRPIPTLQGILTEMLRLARGKRHETSQLLLRLLLALSPVLILLIAFTISRLSGDTVHLISADPKHVMQTVTILLFVIPVSIGYMVWLCYYFSKLSCAAMLIAFAAIDNWEFWKQERRLLPFIRLQLFTMAVLLTAGLLLKPFGHIASQIMESIISLTLFLAGPAVIEQGFTLQGVSEGIDLLLSNMRFVFKFAFLAWIPAFICILQSGEIASWILPFRSQLQWQ